MTVIVLAVEAGGRRDRRRRSPVVASKWLWWQGQMIWPPSTEPTVQPWWGHTASNALKVPAVGWVTTVLAVGEDLAAADRDLGRRRATGGGRARPGGRSRPALPTRSAGAVGTGGLLQAARAPAPTTTPATWRTPRRSVSRRCGRRGSARRCRWTGRCASVGGARAAGRLGGAGVRALGHAFLFRVVVEDLVLLTVVLDVVFFAAAVVAPPRARPLAFGAVAASLPRRRLCLHGAGLRCARAVSAL